jgi:NAD(P)-dependent dehydrogenase (short-subunit alcohol dehydrogenase family)
MRPVTVEETMMDQKTVIVTGSNSGIGFRTALAFARQGHVVVMMCRNQQRGEAARQQIVAESDNNQVDLIMVDLASQGSIRTGVAKFLSRHTRLDVLINNAANFDISQREPVLTDDGTETIFATNHLGPFLLTNLLLPTLKASAPARILNIASKGLIAYPFLDIEFDNLDGQRKFSATHAYYHSKLAQIMFTYALAERLDGTGVTANCIRVPAVKLDDGRIDHVPALLRWIYRFKMRFSLTGESMAETYCRLATAPDFETMTGVYFDEYCQPVNASRQANDREVWSRLWEVSAHLTRLPEMSPVGL